MRRTAIIAAAAWGIGLAATILAPSAWAVKAAPDKTPLLFDRVRAFDAVVVATLPEGFADKTAPVPRSNSVYLPITIEKVLRGQYGPGPWRLSVHQDLPKLLAQRDAKANPSRKYVFVLKQEQDYGWLGAANLYGDLERCYVFDPALEAVVKAFAEAKDEKFGTLWPLCMDLLNRNKAAPLTVPLPRSTENVQPVHALLTRAVTGATIEEWKTLGQADLRRALGELKFSMEQGQDVGGAAAGLRAIAARSDNPAGVMLYDATVAEAARKWLAATVAAKPDPLRPDYAQEQSISAVVGLLADMKDQRAKDALVGTIKSNRWPGLNGQVVGAIKTIFGAKADEVLKDIPANLQAGPDLEGRLRDTPVRATLPPPA